MKEKNGGLLRKILAFWIVITLLIPYNRYFSPRAEVPFPELDPAATSRMSNSISSATSWIEMDFLNDKPAGKHGYIKAVGSDLFFDDGTQARFWGINLQAHAIFRTSDRDIKKHAHRIASLGFNLVRIHHHDSHWVRPNVFGDRSPTTTMLDPSAMAKLDWWIKCLEEEGVYVWLDLHVGRQFRAADGITAYEEIAGNRPAADIRGFNYINRSIIDFMKDFNRQYLSHVNQFTGVPYKDDPAVIAVLITNENDLTHHFGNALLPNKGVPRHNKIYMELSARFADRHGLDPSQTWQAWKDGPSKLFLSDLENEFFSELVRDLRDLGFRGLIATTNSWGRMSMSGLPALTTGDLIDVHSYGKAFEVLADPREKADMLSWIGAAQVADMPLSVSEWNVSPFPAPDRFVAPLRMSVAAAFQGWDAPMLYGYAQQSLSGPMDASNWDAVHDPAILAMMPAAALLFRQQHVAPAEKTYVFAPSAELLFGSSVSPETARSLRTLLEQSRVVIELPEVAELPWLEERNAPEGAVPISSVDRSYVSADATAVQSDTGEIRRDFSEGIFVVETERSQLAAGQIGGKALSMADVRIEVSNAFAAIAVQSLDSNPIRESGRILVSMATQSVPSEQNSSMFVTEPVQGKVYIRAPGNLVLRVPASDGGIAMDHVYANGSHTIDLSDFPGVHWLVLD